MLQILILIPSLLSLITGNTDTPCWLKQSLTNFYLLLSFMLKIVWRPIVWTTIGIRGVMLIYGAIVRTNFSNSRWLFTVTYPPSQNDQLSLWVHRQSIRWSLYRGIWWILITSCWRKLIDSLTLYDVQFVASYSLHSIHLSEEVKEKKKIKLNNMNNLGII